MGWTLKKMHAILFHLYEYKIKIKSLFIWARVQHVTISTEQKSNLKKAKKPPRRKKGSQIERGEKESRKKWQRLGYLWTLKATHLSKRYMKGRDGQKNNR